MTTKTKIQEKIKEIERNNLIQQLIKQKCECHYIYLNASKRTCSYSVCKRCHLLNNYIKNLTKELHKGLNNN